MPRLITISAPSGTGKSSVISQLMPMEELKLSFSISATSRPPRGQEKNGVDYYFLSAQEFRERIDKGDFVEYVEVYPDKFYGTLHQEVERIGQLGRHVIFDVDALGAQMIRRAYPQDSLSIFILPPSVEELRRRLESRGTDSPEIIQERINRAEYEISLAPEFDYQVTNDNLSECVRRVAQIIRTFVTNTP